MEKDLEDASDKVQAGQAAATKRSDPDRDLKAECHNVKLKEELD